MGVIRRVETARTTNPATIMTTELNGLADGSGAITSTAVDNGETVYELDLFMDLELYAASFQATPDADGPIDAYIVRSVDGTNYEAYSAEGRPRNGWVGSFIVDNSTSAQRLIIPDIPIPDRDFHVYLVNQCGAALAANSNTLKAYFHSLQNA